MWDAEPVDAAPVQVRVIAGATRVEIGVDGVDAVGDMFPGGNLARRLCHVAGDPLGDVLTRIRAADPDHEFTHLVEDPAEGHLGKRFATVGRWRQLVAGRGLVREPVGAPSSVMSAV
jgi:hypothetical protein